MFPLPLGEGQGEGAKRSEKKKKGGGLFALLANPAAQPSPKGRGHFGRRRLGLDDCRKVLANHSFSEYSPPDQNLATVGRRLHRTSSQTRWRTPKIFLLGHPMPHSQTAKTCFSIETHYALVCGRSLQSEFAERTMKKIFWLLSVLLLLASVTQTLGGSQKQTN